MAPIRLLVADDHPLFRDGLRALIATLPEAELVGEASSADEAVALAISLAPDVVLMDLQLGAGSGIDATRAIVASDHAPGVLVLTMFDNDDLVFAAMRAGARGYVLKGATQDEVLRAIRGVANGEAIFSPSIARRLIAFFGARPASPAFPELTEREHEILALIAAGASNATIATRLGIRAKTVANHVSAILNKLQVASRAEAIVRAREAGLGGTRPGA